MRRWEAVRNLWCEYDPIGVMKYPDSPRDEYDAYVGPTIGLLDRGATLEEIAAYLREAGTEAIALNQTPAGDAAELAFARRLRAWHAGDPGSR